MLTRLNALRRFDHEWLFSSLSQSRRYMGAGGAAFKVANEIRASLHLL